MPTSRVTEAHAEAVGVPFDLTRAGPLHAASRGARHGRVLAQLLDERRHPAKHLAPRRRHPFARLREVPAAGQRAQLHDELGRIDATQPHKPAIDVDAKRWRRGIRADDARLVAHPTAATGGRLAIGV